MSVAYVLDDLFAEHRPPNSHPERPERILAVRDALREARLPDRGTQLPTRPAREDELGRIHTPGYITDVSRTVAGKEGWLDADTFFSPKTWDAALAAAGAVIDVTEAVLSGQFQRGLALIRPPGHHAEADRAMGFCLLNNVAIAAAAARAAGAARVAIIDWDVHHGNGTQHVFERDSSVLFLSCHQYPFYPGTGSPGEVGLGDAAGTTVNVGLPAGCGDDEYSAVFEHVFVPALIEFRPDVLIVSAGFDAHARDPLASMNVTAAGYRTMACQLGRVADQVADGRVIYALEGGYDLDGLAGGVVAVLDVIDPRAPQQPDRSVSLDDISPGARVAIAVTHQAQAACREVSR